MLSQMNIFKRKDPSPEAISRENDIKSNITIEFSKALKVLQQKQLSSEDPVGSDDDGNNLCNILEAVFLHGLKDSFKHKFANYMNFTTQGQQSEFSLNFWDLVIQFTHGDVVAQLKHLGQITTAIGLCRSWVRVALNDGLIESYIHSLTSDVKTLRYFYVSTAYLRDLEQPGILKSYLTGLATLQFKLSFNSSMLNTWTCTPLTLCGIIENNPTPAPVLSSKPGATESFSSSTQVESSNESPVISHTSRHSKTRNSDLEANQNGGSFYRGLTDSKFGVSGFTSRDVEEIKRLGSSNRPYTTSENSSSSRVSCPDQSHVIPNTECPLIPEQDTRNMLPEQNTLNMLPERNASDVLPEQNISKMLPERNASDVLPERNTLNTLPEQNTADILPERNASDMLPEHISNMLPEQNTFNILPKLNTCTIFDVSALESSILAEIQAENELDIVRNNKTVINLNLNEKPERELVSEANVVEQDVVESACNSLPSKKETAEVSVFDNNDLNVGPNPEDFYNLITTGLTPPTSPKHKTPPLEPSLSPAYANTIEQSTEDVPNIATIRHDIYSVRRTSTDDTPSVTTNSPRGNSLGSMTGWSSDIYERTPKLTEKNLADFKASSEGRSKAASFGALLKTYAPSSSMSNPSIDDVVQNLPSSTDSTDCSPQRRKPSQSSDDPIDGDFEILQAISPYSILDGDSGNNSRIVQLSEMAVEKGLDSQNYQCLSCNRPIGLFYGKPRVCSFNGGYYCFECHENADFYIPAAILHNWDFQKQKVSRESFEFLVEIEDQPLLDVSKANLRLYDHVPELEEIQKLRLQLCSLKTYLFSCQQSLAEELRKKVWPREYLYDSIHVYSMLDFLQVPTGQLAKTLREIVKFASRHVYGCALCSLKGFICELCNNPKVIYPFEIDSTYRCSRCKAVYHTTCMVESLPCPKCQRWGLISGKSQNLQNVAETEDYSITPP